MDGIANSMTGDFESGMALFDEFKLPKKYEGKKCFVVRPTAPINQNAPIRIVLGHAESRSFTPMHLVRGLINFKIVHDDNTQLGKDMTEDDDDKVSVINDIGYGLFESVGVKLVNVPISQHCRMHSWRAYMKQCHSYSPNVKKTNLASEYYAEDDPSDTVVVNEECSGFKARAAAIKRSRECSAAFIPQVDIFSSVRWLAPGHTLELEFKHAGAESYILTRTDKRYKAVITDFKLFVFQIEPTRAIMVSISLVITNIS